MNRKLTTLLIALSFTLGLTSWRTFTGIAAPGTNPETEKPINQYTYLASHNVVASHAYGYDLQNSQRYDVTTQLSGGARMLEIDVVYDTPGDKHPAGV